MRPVRVALFQRPGNAFGTAMQSSPFLAAAAFALLVPVTQPAMADDLSFSIPVTRYELDNGLEVLLHQDHATPVVHVELWYHVGSKDEPEGRSGFAHLFEHLMFNGSLHWDNEYFAPLQPLGARVNGSTSTERTNYYETLPSNALDRALWMEADRMGFLLPVLTQGKLDNQRDVVRNERRQRYEVAPYGVARKAIVEAIWPPGHPYHRLTIGTHEDLEAATLDDVKTFFETWYVPNNATIVVSGDFDLQHARSSIERFFGPIPRGAEPTPVTEAPATPPAAVRLVESDDVRLPRVHWVWQSPSYFADGDADLDVLSSVLSSGKASRLQRRLVFQDRLAKDVYAAQYSAGLGSTYRIVATVAEGKTVEALEAALEDEVTRILAEGPTDEEVERAVNLWRKSFYQRLESVAGKGQMLQSYNHHVGRSDYVAEDLERYLRVTRDSVAKWSREVLDPVHRITLIVQPSSGEEGDQAGKGSPEQ